MRLKIVYAFLIPVLFGLAACTGNLSSSGTGEGSLAADTQLVALSAQQVQVVQNGVRQILSNPAQTQFSNAKALKFAKKPGVHVCGYVEYNGKSHLYYVELRDVSGKPEAERGQVGSDRAKLAKVTFVCRHHKIG